RDDLGAPCWGHRTVRRSFAAAPFRRPRNLGDRPARSRRRRRITNAGRDNSSAAGVMRMPESLAHPATYIPARPSVLVVGDGQITIEEWPLAGSVEERCSLEIRRPNGDLLTIEPKSHSVAVGIVRFVLIVLGGIIPGVIGLSVEAPWWLSIGFSLFIL